MAGLPVTALDETVAVGSYRHRVPQAGQTYELPADVNITGDLTVTGSVPAAAVGDLTGHVTSTGLATLLGSFTAAQLSTALSDVTFSGNNSGDQTNITGNAATVTTNANLTGPVTSVGNATAIADKALAIAKLADGTDGELITWDATGVVATVAVGTSGHVLTSGGIGVAPTFQAAGGGASPLTTKGDLYGYSTVDARLPVGTNDQVLTADSTQTLGVKWAAAAGGGGGWDVEDQTNGNYGHGLNALDSITVGSGLDNIAIGENAGTGLTTGDDNIAIGNAALKFASTTNKNVVIGSLALSNTLMTSAEQNVAIGYQALKSGTVDNAVVIGFDAVSTGSPGLLSSGTVAIGAEALKALDDGARNVAIGNTALRAVVTGNSNTAVGAGAGLVTTGTANCFFGNRSGDGTTTGSYNIVIGSDAISGLDTSAATASDEVVLGTALVGSMTSHTDVDMSGKSLALTGASAFATASTNLDGGDMVVQGGIAATTGIGVGGDLYLRGGTKGATGTTGLVMMDNLPTSDPNVVGALWNNSSVLTISAG